MQIFFGCFGDKETYLGIIGFQKKFEEFDGNGRFDELKSNFNQIMEKI